MNEEGTMQTEPKYLSARRVKNFWRKKQGRGRLTSSQQKIYNKKSDFGKEINRRKTQPLK